MKIETIDQFTRQTVQIIVDEIVIGHTELTC